MNKVGRLTSCAFTAVCFINKYKMNMYLEIKQQLTRTFYIFSTLISTILFALLMSGMLAHLILFQCFLKDAIHSKWSTVNKLS